MIETESVMNNQNIALTDEESGWVAGVADRLRLIQADAASGTPAQRREYLNEEIARGCKGVAPAQRKRYLEALHARFPVSGELVTASAPAPAPAPAPVRAPAPETFEQLFERFLKAAQELPDARRAEVKKQLAEANLAWVDNEKVVLEVTDDLRQALGLPAGQQPHLRNLVQLCALLVEAFHRLDQAALGTMKELNSRSSVLKRPQDFRNAVAQLLIQDDPAMEPLVRMVASLPAALLAAMLGGGKAFGKKHVDRFSPGSIEEVVKAGGRVGVIFSNLEKLCWEQYKRLFKDCESPDLVDRQIRAFMAAFVEREVLGGR